MTCPQCIPCTLDDAVILCDECSKKQREEWDQIPEPLTLTDDEQYELAQRVVSGWTLDQLHELAIEDVLGRYRCDTDSMAEDYENHPPEED